VTFQFILFVILGFFFIVILLIPKNTSFRKLFPLTIVLMMLVFAIKPEWSTKVAQYFGIGRGADFLFYIFNLALFFIALLYYLKFRILDIRIAKLVREIAIQQAKSQRKEALAQKRNA